MKTVGIITIQSLTPNYGNRLQNYATQEVFRSLGTSPCTLMYNPNHFTLKRRISIAIDTLSFGKIKLSKTPTYAIKKQKKFFAFNKKYIDFKYVRNFTRNCNFDLFSVGSDQVWNPTWYDEKQPAIFLLAFNQIAKKIAFSASFGLNALPNEWVEYFAKYIEQMDFISCREEAGAAIVKELTGRCATVLPDPTLLLDDNKWRKISHQPQNINDGYVLTYFLSPKCKEAEIELEELTKERIVYELNNANDKVVREADPSEFLWLFDHADIILTDSFHACVFSFLFNKPFIVYDRNWNGGNMNSRLDTLLSKFHLERKYVNSGLENDIWEHDYTEGYKQLEIERKKAIDFLKKALED